MNITFFKKTNDPKFELVRDLIEELDELYDELSYIDNEDRELNETNERIYSKFEEIIAKIYIRETTIERLCQTTPATQSKYSSLLN